MTIATTIPARPRLRSGIEPRLTDDDTLYLLRDGGGGDDDLLIEADGAWAAAVLELSDGSRSVADIERELASRHLSGSVTLEEALGAFAELELLDDSADDAVRLSPEVAERYDRQLAYFRDVHPGGDASRSQERLATAHVCLIGLGGLGSWTAWALACSGIGRLTAIDGDRVELSNLNRQILYRRSDVGRAKATVAAEALRAFLPELDVTPVAERLESLEEVRAAIDGADLVVNAADWPPHRIDGWVNRACFAASTPYLSMSQQPPLVRVGPLFVPGETGCFACQELAWREAYDHYDELTAAHRPFAPATTFGPACGAVGSLVASEAVHLLGGLGRPESTGAALILDTRGFTFEREPVVRRADCAVCGAG